MTKEDAAAIVSALERLVIVVMGDWASHGDREEARERLSLALQAACPELEHTILGPRHE